MRQLTAIFLISILAVFPASAMGGSPPQAVTSATVLNGVPVGLQISTDKERYRAGEPVRIKLGVKNEGSKDISSNFSSGQSFDIKVYNEQGDMVWSWAHGRVFTQALVPFNLSAGEKKEWEAVWGQIDNSLSQVPAGKYFISGEIVLIPRLYTSRKEIVILF